MHLHKQVFDITAPGSVIHSEHGSAGEVNLILTLAIHAFFNANAALWRFQDEYDAMFDAQYDPPAWQERLDDRGRWQEMYSALNAQTTAPWDPGLQQQATRQLREEKWGGGRMPRAFVQAYPLMAAEGVLSALAQVGAYLQLLSTHPGVLPAAQQAAARFHTAWPQVLAARSAVLHPEDRVRALLAQRTPTMLSPMHDMQAAVGTGSSLVGGHLDYMTLVFTGADGRIHGLDITNQTLQAVQAVLQDVLNRCAWHGPAIIEPN